MKSLFFALLLLPMLSFADGGHSYAGSTLSCLMSSSAAPHGVDNPDTQSFGSEAYFQVISIDYDPSLYSGRNKVKEIYFGYVPGEYEYLTELAPVKSEEKAILRVSFASSGDAFGIYIKPVGYGRGADGQAILDPRERKSAAAATAYRESAGSEVTITTISCAIK